MCRVAAGAGAAGGTGVAPRFSTAAARRAAATTRAEDEMSESSRGEREGERARGREDQERATEAEREGMDLLGRESVRDDAIPGVSGVGGIADLPRDASRRNPPELDDVGNMAGDVSQSGGAAGGTEEGPPEPRR